jgi:hypothetical protein
MTICATAIKNTNSVIHFLGKENPIALRKAEVNKCWVKWMKWQKPAV